MRIGVDLGGTKIEVIALDDDGAEVLRRRISTPSDDYRGTVVAIGELVRGAESELDTSATVGVGTPGSLSPTTGLMRNSNSLALNGMPLDRDLTVELGREVRTANDANCFALSETIDGAGQGQRTVFGVILGTGVGGGVVVDGSVLVGPNAIAGEWGHNPMPGESNEARSCYCGRVNCIELFLSGPALEAEYQFRTNSSLSPEAMVATASTDTDAAAVLDQYIDRLARALAGVINILDPDVVILGGGMSNIDLLYEEVPARWGKWVFSDAVSTTLLPNHHGDSSGVRGAAWLWA